MPMKIPPATAFPARAPRGPGCRPPSRARRACARPAPLRAPTPFQSRGYACLAY